MMRTRRGVIKMSSCGESGLQLMWMTLTSLQIGYGKFLLSVLVIGISSVIVRRLLPWIDRSSDLYSTLWILYIKISSPSSGGHSIPKSVTSETNKLKTLAECTMYLQSTMVLTILFSVIQAVLLMLIIWS